VSGSSTAAQGEIVGYDVAVEGDALFVERMADRIMLRRDLRLWPGFGAAMRASRCSEAAPRGCELLR
jgi:hypothetical protein